MLVTLVGQGLTLPALLRALGVRGERPWSPDEAIARLETAQAALDRLDELEDEGASEELLRRLRELYRARFRACQAVLGGESDDGRPPEDPRLHRYGDLRRDLITVERDTLLRMRNAGELRNETLRNIEHDLDLDEARLRADGQPGAARPSAPRAPGARRGAAAASASSRRSRSSAAARRRSRRRSAARRARRRPRSGPRRARTRRARAASPRTALRSAARAPPRAVRGRAHAAPPRSRAPRRRCG